MTVSLVGLWNVMLSPHLGEFSRGMSWVILWHSCRLQFSRLGEPQQWWWALHLWSLLGIVSPPRDRFLSPIPSRDMEGVPKFKSRSRDPFTTPFDLVLNFFDNVPCNQSVKFDASIFISGRYMAILLLSWFVWEMPIPAHFREVFWGTTSLFQRSDILLHFKREQLKVKLCWKWRQISHFLTHCENYGRGGRDL